MVAHDTRILGILSIVNGPRKPEFDGDCHSMHNWELRGWLCDHPIVEKGIEIINVKP